MRAELISWQIRAGVWQGMVAASDPPRIEIRAGAVTLADPIIQPDGPDTWRVEAAIPRDMISDGVHGFVVTDATYGAQLGAFSLAIGVATGGDLVAEVAQLRTEIELLKAAFRRQNRRD